MPPKGKFRENTYDEAQPLSRTLGLMFSNEVKNIAVDQAQRVWYAIRTFHHEAIGYMKRTERPFFWPLELGGFGFRLPTRDYKRFWEPTPVNQEFSRYASLATANYWKHKDAEEDTRYAVYGNLSLDLRRRMKLLQNGRSNNVEYLKAVRNAYAIADAKTKNLVTYRNARLGRSKLKDVEQDVLGGMLMVLSLDPNYDKRESERSKLGNPKIIKRFVTRTLQVDRKGTGWMKGVYNPLTAYKRVDRSNLYVKSEEVDAIRKEVKLGKIVQDYDNLRPLLSDWEKKCNAS
jgi:hypothetical protein